MKERPIIFSGEMVRAILDGRKTLTRRTVKPQPPATHSFGGYVIEASPRKNEGKFKWGIKKGGYRFADPMYLRCPYGQPGDRLWVREAWGLSGSEANTKLADYHDPERMLRPYLVHRATVDSYDLEVQHWRPSIHMPRWASRILLEVTAVRVERLQDITEADAIAEGIRRHGDSDRLWARGPLAGDQNIVNCTGFPTLAFRSIWESINGPDSWDANPWVWVVEFRRIEQESTAA